MRRRGEPVEPALRRWHFPELDPPAETAGVAAAIGAAAPLPPPEEPAAAADKPDPEADRQRVAAELARGYAEGVERGIAAGRERGYQDGFAAGHEAAQQALAADARRIAALAERLAAPIPAVERVIEDAIIGLALELARCVIGVEITRSPDSLVHLIREALTKAPVSLNGLRIALNPADLDLVRRLAPEIEEGGATLAGDNEVEAGGCMIALDEGAGPVKDRRWRPRAGETGPHIDLSAPARWRTAMLALFDGEAT